MHFKGSFGIAVVALSLSGCGVMGSKDLPIANNTVGGAGCLNESKDLVARYVAGDINQTEWKAAFDCINQSLDFFTGYVHGANAGSYTPDDMYTLVSRFLITNHPVHKDLMLGAFSLKAGLFGGSSNTFTKDEIELLKNSLTRLQAITGDLIPYLALRKQGNVSTDQLLDMVAAFKLAGEQLSDFINTLPTQMMSNEAMSTLINELQTSLGLDSISGLSDTFFSVKWLAFNSRKDAIERSDWAQIFRTSLGFAGIILAYKTSVGEDINDPRHNVSDRLQNDYLFREFLWELALNAKPYIEEMLTKHNGSTPLPVFDDIIDDLPNELLNGIPKQTLKQTLRPFVRKFLISSTQIGVDKGVIDTVYSLLDGIVRDLGLLDRLYENANLDRLGVKPVQLVQAIDQFASNLSGADDKARFAQIKDHLLLHKPMFYKDTTQIRFDFGDGGYTKLQNMFVLVVDRIARHVVKTYGTAPNAMNGEDLRIFFEEYTQILFALKAVDPTVPNFAANRLRDMDLFTGVSNGDNLASVPEIVNYAMIIMSSGVMTDKMRTEITAKCDRNLGQDIMGWTWLPADCFRQEFNKNLEHWIDQFPRMKFYWSGLSDAEKEKAMIWLEHGSRRNGYNNDDFGRFDIGAMATILHYTETLFTRFDFDNNETLSKAEIMTAYPTFTNILAKKAKMDPSKSFMLKGIFTYIVKYREMPDTSGVSPIAKLLWWLGIYTLPTTHYSSDRLGVFNIVCQLAVPESDAQQNLTKTICK